MHRTSFCSFRMVSFYIFIDDLFKVISKLKWLTGISSLATFVLSPRASLLVLKGANGDWFIHMPMRAQRQGLTSHSSFAECVAV